MTASKSLAKLIEKDLRARARADAAARKIDQAMAHVEQMQTKLAVAEAHVTHARAKLAAAQAGLKGARDAAAAAAAEAEQVATQLTLLQHEQAKATKYASFMAGLRAEHMENEAKREAEQRARRANRIIEADGPPEGWEDA